MDFLLSLQMAIYHNYIICIIYQSINQSKPVFLFILERVRIPRTGRAGGLAVLKGALLLRVGSSRQFLTEDLHASLSRVNSSVKRQASRSSFTHSAQVFLARAGPIFPETFLFLTVYYLEVFFTLTSPSVLLRSVFHTKLPKWHVQTQESIICTPSKWTYTFIGIHGQAQTKRILCNEIKSSIENKQKNKIKA